MCIRDRLNLGKKHILAFAILFYLVSFSLFSNVLMLIGTSYGERVLYTCLLYTSDAADERSSVDLGGRRIIKKKNNKN